MSNIDENILENDSFSSEDDLEEEQICHTTEDTITTSTDLSKLSICEETCELSLYGVDWSEHAESKSHCWLPYLSNKSSSNFCVYTSCEYNKLSSNLSFIQCATCLIMMHSIHLSELKKAKLNLNESIRECRPSFIDDNIDMNDNHYWSHVPILTEPCTYCKHRSLTDSSRTFISGKTNSKLNESSSGLICLWCHRRYHKKCWENINNKCDYGKLGNIVVRPQWLHRISNNSFGFRAQMSNNIEMLNTSLRPIIFFINKKSGGQKGEEVYRKLVHLLNPRQVFLLENDKIIIEALNIYSSLTNIRICICGGDGTVAWILNHLLDGFPLLKNPPTGICPLGTGNDMSRALGWGCQYKSKYFIKTIMQISHANPVKLDRWKIELESLEINTLNNEFINNRRRFFSFMNHPKFIRNANQSFNENSRTPVNTVFFNYISFGLDAAIVLDYQTCRSNNPSKFTSPFKNKILCINESRKYFNDFAFGITWNLSSYIRLICDGNDLTHLIQNCHSLVLLNTRSFASGTHPWGRISSQSNDDTLTSSPTTNHFDTQDFGDQKIEILGLNTKQMALIRMGFHGYRIAQSSQVRIELNHPMAVHMDGGPFYLPGSTAVNIKHAGQVLVVTNQNR